MLVKPGQGFGASIARQFRHEADLVSIVECMARNTRFEGFCGFDWIRENRTSKPYVVEFYPRATSGIRSGRACGVSFSQIAAEWDDKTATHYTQTQPVGTRIEAHYTGGVCATGFPDGTDTTTFTGTTLPCCSRDAIKCWAGVSEL